MALLNTAIALWINVVFNVRMSPTETRTLIDAAGGDTPFAILLGLSSKSGYQQRVNNWKRRGLPASIELAHLDLIQTLKNRAASDVQKEVA